VSRVNLALFSFTLLLCMLVGSAPAVFSQTAAKPAPLNVPTSAEIKTTVTENSVDSRVPDDAAVDKMLEVYSPRVRALDQIIGKLKGDLKKGGTGGGSLGNFVTDGMRAQASQKLGTPILLAITNSGGLRKNVIGEGDLRSLDIFELLPFENALVAFDLTGAQVLDLLRVVVSRRDVQSGARIKYRIIDKKMELEDARFLINGLEKEIDPGAIYTVVSIDYLLKVTGGDYATVLREAKNARPLGLTIRDAISDYVKAETAANREIKATYDGRFVFDKAASPGAEEPKP